MDPAVVVALAVFGLVGGVGVSAIGPGGVLPTIGLFALTGLSPAGVAGTAIVTHVATGLLGTTAYRRSGHLDAPPARRAAGILVGTALLGTPVGVLVNRHVEPGAFGVVLAATAVLVAGLVIRRQFLGPRRSPGVDDGVVDAGVVPPTAVLIVVGVAVSVVSGLVGIGGPMLTVPLLIGLGTPALTALGVAQAQSVVVAGVGTVGYLAVGAIDWPLAALVGLPELVGVLIGWRVARAVPARALAATAVVALLAVAPYLAVRG